MVQTEPKRKEKNYARITPHRLPKRKRRNESHGENVSQECARFSRGLEDGPRFKNCGTRHPGSRVIAKG